MVECQTSDPHRAFTRVPGLEYRHAFDLCAVEVQRCGEPVVLRASSAFYVYEVMKRIEALRPAQVVGGGMGGEQEELLWRLGPEADVAQAWSVAAPHSRPGFYVWAETAGIAGLGMPGGPWAAAAVWAEPERQAGDHALQSFERYLAPGGRLCAITSGWLRRGLPEWRGEGDRPARDPAGLCRTLAWLRRAGFAVEAVYGFHGPRSLVWGIAGRILAALRREDLVDRYFAAMRRDYGVHGWQAHGAPVAVVLARKR